MKLVLTLVLHWLHLIAAATWVGGLIFNLFILTPNLAAIELRPRATLISRVMRRFLHFVWGAIVLLVATGLLRIFLISHVTGLQFFVTSTYGYALAGKMGVVAMMIGIALYISYSLYPKISSHLKEHESEEVRVEKCSVCRELFSRTRRLMTTVFILGLAAIFLAAFLRGA